MDAMAQSEVNVTKWRLDYGVAEVWTTWPRERSTTIVIGTDIGRGQEWERAVKL